jgi:hypothetical protein
MPKGTGIFVEGKFRAGRNQVPFDRLKPVLHQRQAEACPTSARAAQAVPNSIGTRINGGGIREARLLEGLAGLHARKLHAALPP